MPRLPTFPAHGRWIRSSLRSILEMAASPQAAEAPASLVIMQTGAEMTVRVGNEKTSYTLDDKLMVVPPGDVLALKTHAHWEGQKLHLHFKKGMNWGRDILGMEGGKLVVVRDVESGGASTTFKITYSKQ